MGRPLGSRLPGDIRKEHRRAQAKLKRLALLAEEKMEYALAVADLQAQELQHSNRSPIRVLDAAGVLIATIDPVTRQRFDLAGRRLYTHPLPIPHAH